MMDPLGRTDIRRIALAARQPLSGTTVVVYDNGKCHPTFGSYWALLDRLEERLGEAGATVVRKFHDASVSSHLHLPAGDSPHLRELVQSFESTGARAAVLAVGDAGVSDATARLALALEDAGMATATVYTELGIQIGRAMAMAQAPALPTVMITEPWEAPEEDMARAADRVFPEIAQALEQMPQSEGQSEASDVFEGVNDAAGLFERLTERELGDGLPVVMPNEELVERLLATAGLAPDHVLIPRMMPRGGVLTAGVLATNAVMAGCLPEYFPILLALVEAVAQPRYHIDVANITTHPSGNLIVVSGPYGKKAGVASGGGALGPGARNRANLAIGRTLTLLAAHVAGARLGAGDLSVLGSPAEIAYCVGEDIDDSPWPGLNSDLTGDQGKTVVFAGKCEGPHNVLDQLSRTPQDLLRGFALAAASGAGNNAYSPYGPLVVMLNPRHAALIAEAGWSKRDVVDFLYNEARVDAQALRGRGIRGSWPAGWEGLSRVPVVADKEDIVVVVTGARGGVQSAVAVPWGYNRSVHGVVRTPEGKE